MRLTRPQLSRNASAPAPEHGANAPLREQTMRTLNMLKNMGYHDVWCKTSEVDAQLIDRALAEGWRVCDVEGERIKFTLHPGTPITPGTALRRSSALRDRHSRVTTRTTSPTRLTPEARPSPMALYRKAMSDAGPPSPNEPAATSRRRNSPEAPAVVVSPPPEDYPRDDDELGELGVDYFTFIPVTRHDLEGFTPPEGSWLERRMAENPSRPDSLASAYSVDSVPERPFEFDSRESVAAQPYRPSPLGSGLAAARQAFRPRTPELRMGGLGRGMAGLNQPQAERPAHTLNRFFSDPGNNSEPSFELLPLMPPSWRNRGT